MNLRVFCCATLTLLCFPASADAQTSGAQRDDPDGVKRVNNLRIGLTEGRTRLVFDVENNGDYRSFTLDSPHRIVLDFPNASSGFNHRQVAVAGTPVRQIRSATQPDGTLRYVFDLRDAVTLKVFPVSPSQQQGRGHRVVLDLYADPRVVTGTDKSKADVESPSAAAPDQPRRVPLRPAPSINPQAAKVAHNPNAASTSGQWSGSVSLQARLFPEDPAFADQDNQNVSTALEPEYFIDWDNGRQRFAFHGFARVDANDTERTHVDLREFYWRMDRGPIVFKAGLDVVFWGVTESRHLVDIINQTDRVENIDREDKLGQPMLSLDYLSDSAGTWQGWILPYFRERTFPGEDGRLRTQPPVDTDNPIWDSDDEEEHVDFALRWSHYIGDWDIGLAHFSGTGREPFFVFENSADGPVLRPFYVQIDQTSLDLQATIDAWLWKLEAIYNSNRVEDFYATTAGWEYTRFGIGGSAADLGWLLEYHYDERGETLQEALQNDLYTGLRWSGNDIAGTRLLAGFTVDLDNGSTFGNVEAVRRLGDSWTITVEARAFFNTDEEDPLNFFSEDSYLEIQLDRFF